MLLYPIQYDEPLFRPPSEARSLIIQITLGCSWNKCAFCEMYTDKKFQARKEADVFRDIEAFESYSHQIRKVFLADGDPLVLSTDRLLRILQKLTITFPKLNRISTYASPGNLMKKSLTELIELKEAGLNLLYVGIESGDDKVLETIQKGETFVSTVEGLNKSKQAGMASSVMIINGVGGISMSKQHANYSAKVLNETQPKYASTLVLSHYKGLSHFQSRYKGDFAPLSVESLTKEMLQFIKATDLDETIFRSDHVSNHLILKGVLGRDKEKFIEQIRFALNNPGPNTLQNERMQGLF